MLPRKGSPSKASIGQNNNNNWRLKLVGNSVGTELDNGLVLSKTRLPFTETWLAWNKIRLPTMRLVASSGGANR